MNLKEMRLSHFMKQQELIRLSNVSLSTLSRYEQGRTQRPDMVHVNSISTALEEDMGAVYTAIFNSRFSKIGEKKKRVSKKNTE